ncbi:MAG: transferrin-binding protein-like solute binding protein [Rhodobacteraceae bacterium]|nr:transferrin-binding protein-like solute binding protein [Paracoccaceae bacterium]
MTKRLVIPALALAGATFLTACGGGGGDGPLVPEVDPRTVHPADASDTIARRISEARTLAQATTFTARAVGVDRAVSDDGRHTGNRPADPEDIQVQFFRTAPDAIPTVRVTHRGTPTTFTPADLNAVGTYVIEDPSAPEHLNQQFFWTWGDTTAEHADGQSDDGTPINRKYHTPISFYFDGVPNQFERTAVIGLATSPASRPASGTASYTGQTRLVVYDTEGANVQERRRFGTDLVLTADFSDMTISGEMDNWRQQGLDRDDLPLPGLSHILKETTITAIGFTTTVEATEDCTRCAGIVESTVTGTFYGPEANEAGGTMQLENMEGDVLSGIFYTTQD